jgi:hypothetical protein
MPVAEPAFGWPDALAAFAIIAVAAFLVTWVFTDLLRMPRTPYIGVLLFVSLGLCAGYLAWSGTSPSDLVTPNWIWGIVGGLIAAAVASLLVRRISSRPRATGPRMGRLLLWEGVVYGLAEALLLATLPVLAVWQACVDLGWTTGAWAKVGSGTFAVVGALFVILVHHLGYAEFRTPESRTGLIGTLAVCGLQAVAFLLTGSVVAPVLAHIVLHAQMLFRGAELPPAESRAVTIPELGATSKLTVRPTRTRNGVRR